MTIFRKHRLPSAPCPNLHTLDRYMVRELTATRSLSTKRHLATCDSCRRITREAFTQFKRLDISVHVINLHKQTYEVRRLPRFR